MKRRNAVKDETWKEVCEVSDAIISMMEKAGLNIYDGKRVLDRVRSRLDEVKISFAG